MTPAAVRQSLESRDSATLIHQLRGIAGQAPEAAKISQEIADRFDQEAATIRDVLGDRGHNAGTVELLLHLPDVEVRAFFDGK